MRKCRDVASPLSEGWERSLPWSSRIGVRFHLLLCGSCRQYARQLRWLSRTYRELTAKARGATLTAEVRERIRTEFDHQRDDPAE
ncbi:MAG: hypothetical protein WCC36_06680 [Gammaproteobacteria bacterium]